MHNARRVAPIVAICLTTLAGCELFELSPFPAYYGFVAERNAQAFMNTDNELIDIDPASFVYRFIAVPQGRSDDARYIFLMEQSSNGENLNLYQFGINPDDAVLNALNAFGPGLDPSPVSELGQIASTDSSMRHGPPVWLYITPDNTVSHVIGDVIASNLEAAGVFGRHSLGATFGAQVDHGPAATGRASDRTLFVLFETLLGESEWMVEATLVGENFENPSVTIISTGVPLNEKFSIEGISRKIDDGDGTPFFDGFWLDVFRNNQLMRFQIGNSNLDDASPATAEDNIIWRALNSAGNLFNFADDDSISMDAIDGYQQGTLVYLDLNNGQEIVIQHTNGFYQRYIGTTAEERAPYRLPRPINSTNRLHLAFFPTDEAQPLYYIFDEAREVVYRVRRWW